MTSNATGRLARMRKWGLLPRIAILATATLVIGGVTAPIGWYLSDMRGLAAVGTAGGVCLAGAVAALVVSHLLRAPAVALYGMLFGMMFRLGIPLAFAVSVRLSGVLADAGVLYYLVAFYPVTLGVETALSLPATDGPCRGAAPKNAQGNVSSANSNTKKTFQDVS